MADLEELKGLVQNTLEAKGVLGKLKAQLRAAVYTAIDEQERGNGIHLHDERLEALRSDAEHAKAVNLVIEFLTFYNLDATLSCLLPEIGFSRSDIRSRTSTAESVGLRGSSDAPLLAELLKHGGPVSTSGSSFLTAGAGAGVGTGSDNTERTRGLTSDEPEVHRTHSFKLGRPSDTLTPVATADDSMTSLPRSAAVDVDAASDSFDSESFASPSGRSTEFSPAVTRVSLRQRNADRAPSSLSHGFMGADGGDGDGDGDGVGDGDGDQEGGIGTDLDGGGKVQDVAGMDDALDREFALALATRESEDRVARAAPREAAGDVSESAPSHLSDTVRHHVSMTAASGDGNGGEAKADPPTLPPPKGRGLSRSHGLGSLPPVNPGQPRGGSGLASLSSLPPVGGTASGGARGDEDPMTPKWFNAPDSPNAEPRHQRAAPPASAAQRSRLQELDEQLRAIESEEDTDAPASSQHAALASPSGSAGTDEYDDDDFDDDFDDDLLLDDDNLDNLSTSNGDLDISGDPLSRRFDTTDKSGSMSMSLNASQNMFESAHDMSVDSQALENYDFVESIG